MPRQPGIGLPGPSLAQSAVAVAHQRWFLDWPADPLTELARHRRASSGNLLESPSRQPPRPFGAGQSGNGILITTRKRRWLVLGPLSGQGLVAGEP